MNLENIKDIKKTILILVIISSILIIFLAFSIYNKTFTGRAVGDTYTYTKAICDENNFCEDYEIVCKGKEVVSINPTGFSVQNYEEWEDPRNESQQNRNGLCEIGE